MAFSRVAAMRSCFRAARPTVPRPQLLRNAARRTYATDPHKAAKASGDAVWAAGAVAVTIPTCWFLLSNQHESSHGHDEHHDSHGKEHDEDEKEEDEPKEEEEDNSEDKPEEPQAEENAEKDDDKDSEKSEDSESGDDGGSDTPDSSEDENENDGPKKVEKKDGNTKKIIPDAKGGNKLRLESDQGTKAGETGEQGATAGKHSGAQEGLSNTDTKHSTDISENPDKSKKAEGTPETAKTKGPVDPNRPAA